MADGRAVVVTGAGSGVGRAVAAVFAGQGWQVALVGRREAPLTETLAALAPDAAARCVTLPCDVAAAANVRTMAAAVLERFGRVDVLVNSAGLNVPHRALSVLSDHDWHEVLETNLSGAYYCVQAFLPAMRAQGAGTIVHVNSDVGKRARELAGAAYVASKFGLAGLSQQINAEERRHGIRSCSIFPRDINTPLLDKRPQPPPADVRAAMMQPEDVAACVWFVATLPARAIVEEIDITSR
jgi:NAD(P)-dependent dehydrogenase (short-subunit alcohol dehydrogenase family)